jgi:hypothetical protein
MRSVALVHSPMSLLAGFGAMAVMTTALSIPAFATDPSAPEQKIARATEDDYYTRRAKAVLEAERAALVRPHPLAASHPGKEIVVCEAGCEGRAPQVVFLRPEIPETVETGESVMIPTSTSDGRAVPLDEVACIAGCYGASTVVYVAPAPEPEASLPAVSVEDWTPPLRQRETIDDKLSPVR